MSAKKMIWILMLFSGFALAQSGGFYQASYQQGNIPTYDLDGYDVILDYNAENETSGSTLSAWDTDPNSSGTASATQGTASLRPSVVTESDGHLAVDFDGVDDYLTLGSQSDFDPAIGTTTFAIFLVRGEDPGSGGGTAMFSDRESSARDVNIGQTGTSNFLIQIGTGHQVFESGVSTTDPVLLSVVATTTTVKTYVNGTNGNDNAIGGYNSNTRDFVIGARSDPGTYYGGTIRRIVVVSPAPNDTVRAEIEAILTANNM